MQPPRPLDIGKGSVVVLAFANQFVMFRHGAESEVQVGRQGTQKLKSLVQAPHVEDVVVEAPGDAVELVGPVEERLVELCVPAADDGIVLTALVKLT